MSKPKNPNYDHWPWVPQSSSPPSNGGGNGNGNGQTQVTRFEKTFSSKDEVVCNHNLGYYPVVQVIIGNRIVEADISHTSLNSFTVQFNQSQTGRIEAI